MMKTCDAHRDDFSLYFDRQMDAPANAAFEAHQKDCESCRGEYGRFSASAEKLAGWINSTSSLAGAEMTAPIPDAGRPVKIQKKSEPKPLRFPILDWIVAVAAIVLVAVGVSRWRSAAPVAPEKKGNAVAEDSGPPKKPPVSDKASSDEETRKALEHAIARLSSNEFKEREQAQADLVKLGVKAEDAVQAAQKAATNPEVRSRLEAVLQAFALIDEDAYALAQIKKGLAFPQKESFAISIDDPKTVGRAVSEIAQQTKLKIEIYPKDKALAAIIQEAPSKYTFGSAPAPDSACTALTLFLSPVDATYVIDEGRVVIVRMTPAVFFAKLCLESLEFGDQDPVAQFEGRTQDCESSMRGFLQKKFQGDKVSGKKWLDEMVSRVNDPAETKSCRAHVLETIASLCQVSETAEEMVLKMLEGADAEGQLSLLHAIGSPYAIGQGPKRTRYFAAVRKLEKSANAEVAIRALCVLANHGDTLAIGALADAPRPVDRTTIHMFINALSRRDGETWAPVVRGPGRTRLDAYGKDASEDIRALYAYYLGFFQGGPERRPDVDALEMLLNDTSPLVRGMAVQSLRITYGAAAATPFREKLGDIRKRLEEMKKTEHDKRVLQEIETGLKEMPKE